jgi:putative ABC transport system ATP-binding protein
MEARNGRSPGFDFVDVVVERDRVRALDGFTAAIPGQGVTALFGPSGSGKSTLLRLCNRLEVPTSGRVSFCGRDIAALDPLRLRRRVGMCFQRPTLFPGTVADNLRIAEPEASEAQMRETLEQVLLLDEPTSAVDAEAARVIERAVRELADDGMPALWVTHDRAQAERAADRVLHIERGRCAGQVTS